MTELQALLMGLLQGLTEYLPVSSSGHLTIASALFGISGEENLTFTIAVHVATVLSTLVILWREIVWLLRGLVDTKAPLMSPERRYILAIIISMIPIGIVGVFFKDYVEAIFGSGLLIVGLCLIITSALLTLSYYARPRQNEEIGLMQAFIIGLAQSVAVLPGLSRSGTTIATGLLLGVKKEKMAQFSFLMVIPPILGEGLLNILEVAEAGWAQAFGELSISALVVGFLAAFISGIAACKWMIAIVAKGKLIYFAIYCLLVGITTLCFA
jgi:undecaprenyl-diphosphatase